MSDLRAHVRDVRCLEAARRKGYARCCLETLASMTAANRLYRSFGFRPLPQPMGQTGHFSCDTWYVLDFQGE
jgi:putative acetyltransferase